MGSPIHLNELMGSSEAHLLVVQNRLNTAKEDLQRAEDAGKPQAQIDGLRAMVESAEEELRRLEKEIQPPS